MKKKILSLIAVIFSVFLIGSTDVSAANNPYQVSAHDIPSDTYVIGTHMFDENRSYLSTEDIMWASLSIEAESKEDMVIYYKDLNGIWINGITGEAITVPSTFKIEEYNGEEAKMVLINAVLEEADCEGATCYSSIYEDDYDEMSITIPVEEGIDSKEYDVIFDAHNFKDGEYGLNISCTNYKYDEEKEEIVEEEFSIGTIPTNITVGNGVFRLPFNINTTNLGSAFCILELEKDHNIFESMFIIDSTDSIPQLHAEMLDMTARPVDGEGIGFYPVFKNSDNEFEDYYMEDTKVEEFAIQFLSRFIEDGDYKIQVNAFKDNEPIELIDAPTTITIDSDFSLLPYGTELGIKLPERLNIGEYQFEIILYNSNDEDIAIETVYLNIIDERRPMMEISSEIWEQPNEIYYSSDNFVFDNTKKRKFTTTFFTENIPDGKYAIKAELEYINMVIPSNIEWKAYQNIEIIDGEEVDYFDYDFEIQKGAFEGWYRVNLTLHELIEDEYGYVVPSDDVFASNGFSFKIVPKSPTLNNKTLSGDLESATYDIGINFSDYESNSIDGWELYVSVNQNNGYVEEIDGENYYLYSDNGNTDISQIDIPNGETIKFIARTYKNQNETISGPISQKLYSEWSDVMEITYTK